VHLPAASCFLEGKTLEAAPKCGAAVAYDFLAAKEPLEAEVQLCKRCSPSSTERAWECICSYMFLSKSVVVYRCFRRCDKEGAHDEHLCSLHADRPKREGPKDK
jgi:hypothetical protein